MRDKTTPAPRTSRATGPGLAEIGVTLLVGIAAIVIVIAQFHYNQDPASQLSLSNLNQRISVLEKITNLVQRDSVCIPLSAYGRALDQALPSGTRVFITGMIGEPNGSLGYYFFLRNYLFPHDVEISLDGKAIYHNDGFSGVPCDSSAVLTSNGFDLMIQYSDNKMNLIPLTPKGVPRAE